MDFYDLKWILGLALLVASCGEELPTSQSSSTEINCGVSFETDTESSFLRDASGEYVDVEEEFYTAGGWFPRYDPVTGNRQIFRKGFKVAEDRFGTMSFDFHSSSDSEPFRSHVPAIMDRVRVGPVLVGQFEGYRMVETQYSPSSACLVYLAKKEDWLRVIGPVSTKDILRPEEIESAARELTLRAFN